MGIIQIAQDAATFALLGYVETPTSSCMSGFRYNKDDDTITIYFRKGKPMTYDSSLAEAFGLYMAGSKGAYFNDTFAG